MAVTAFLQQLKFRHLLSSTLLVLLAGSLFFLFQPRKKVVPAFYYWKTTFHLTSSEKQALQKLEIKRLYLRLFDIGWDNTLNAPVPLGKIVFDDHNFYSAEIVPVVYITNRVITNINTNQVATVATHLLKQVQSIAKSGVFSFTELQIDCDWTETTRAKYFGLLKQLSSMAAMNGVKISATIRLHQIKYKQITGIPPVERGMLMFYNMGDLSEATNRNSIYNQHDASKYVSYVSSYPLPLDVALPIFSWAIQRRNGVIVQLISSFNPSDFERLGFSRIDSGYYKTTTSFFYRGIYFKMDDIIEIESITPKIALEAAMLLSKHIQHTNRSVALFSLDSLNVAPYEKKDFKAIYNCFR